MSKKVNDLVGAAITSFIEIHDYKQMVTDGGIINFYNPMSCCSLQGDTIDFMKIPESLSNPVITKIVVKKNEYLRLEINSEVIIDVSLKDDDYTCPEAASIYFETGEIMVIQG